MYRQRRKRYSKIYILCDKKSFVDAKNNLNAVKICSDNFVLIKNVKEITINKQNKKQNEAIVVLDSQKIIVNDFKEILNNNFVLYIYRNYVFEIVESIDKLNILLSTSIMDNNQYLYMYCKRFFDILFSTLCILTVLPLFTIFIKALYVANGDNAKLIYSQDRIGKDGKVFRIYKYRTMVLNADYKLNDLLREPIFEKQWNDMQKIDNDPRITKIGNRIRKNGVDEIPQLINVLKGDMSFIGPRPLVKGELEKHNGSEIYRKVRPGITGWWACDDRSNMEYSRRLNMEYFYVNNCSLHLDIICIHRTLLAIIRKEGK